MLAELRIAGLGVIDEVEVVFGPGLTAVTGETGAGKTMIMGAVELLLGGRADPSIVRPGAVEAVVEGRFLVDDGDLGCGVDGDPLDGEFVLRRVVPADGRSRAYVNGRLETATALAEVAGRLVDLHGQHAHQRLLGAAAQRDALDRFGAIDLVPLAEAHRRVVEIDAELNTFGGDERARVREIDLLRYQVSELDAAGLNDPNEDDQLAAEELLLGDAVAHREAASAALELLDGDGLASEAVGRALAALDGRSPFDGASVRLMGLVAELGDLASDLRVIAEGLEEDPARLDVVGERRRLLAELRRKYGDDLASVIGYHREVADRLRALEDHEARASALDAERLVAEAARAGAAATVREARRRAAPGLADRICEHLRSLAMPMATVEVAVDGEAGEEVEFRLSPNSGSPMLPLARVASGGELARTMLAVGMVLTASPPVQLFDEVDAGVGGETAHRIGESLAALAADRQVLVVTHLAQVAAYADQQMLVAKVDDGEQTVASIRALDSDNRVIELSRMLSGSPDSETARGHAVELLVAARRLT
ncbi:MAG: DNA repair protein RecN [Acidimicrobiaceae bacterium]|nr:DNA repair protein RecN [Acidimicrobiaceae bacterium]